MVRAGCDADAPASREHRAEAHRSLARFTRGVGDRGAPSAIERLQENGFFVTGLDGDAEATVFDEPCPPGRVAVVIGSEGEGMARLTREKCDVLISLPMRGRVASLNASASLAATLYAYVLASRA